MGDWVANAYEKNPNRKPSPSLDFAEPRSVQCCTTRSVLTDPRTKTQAINKAIKLVSPPSTISTGDYKIAPSFLWISLPQRSPRLKRPLNSQGQYFIFYDDGSTFSILLVKIEKRSSLIVLLFYNIGEGRRHMPWNENSQKWPKH